MTERGPRPGRNCRQMSFESLVPISGARTTRRPCAATRCPPSPANIAEANSPFIGEKFVSPCSHTPKSAADAQTRHLSTRGRHLSARGRHLSPSVATERGLRHPVTKARPNILSREQKNFLEKDDIGRHPIPFRYPFRRRLRRLPRTQPAASRTGGPETRTPPRSRPISGRRPHRNQLAAASAEAYNEADERPIPTT